MDYISDIENKEYSIEEIMKRWGECLHFLDGFPEDKKEILAINFENMAHYLIYDNENDTDGSFETIIFPIIRKITSEVPIKFDCRMLTTYILNSKWENVQKYVNNDVKKIIEQNKDRGIFDILNSENECYTAYDKEKIDLEAEICAALSEYLIDKLK